MISIPKRRFQFDIEGKIFEASELSARYLLDAQQNPDTDTVDAALKDSMTLTDDDYRLFGKDALEQMYSEIVKFTFEEKVSGKELIKVMEVLSLTDAEMQTLSVDVKVQLSAIIKKRTEPPTKGKL